MEKYAHLKKYVDFNWHTHYSPEREELHAQIIESHFLKLQQMENPIILFTGGCYGAGKGHTIRYLHSVGKIDLTNWVHADPDKIRTQFPEYKTSLTEQQENVSKEAGYIVELIEYYALENNYNIIVDGSLHDWVWHLEHFEMIKNVFHRFEIVVIFVLAHLETILQRNIKRCNEISRCVPETTIIKIFSKISVAFDEYSKVIKKCYQVRNYSDDADQDFLDDISKIII